MPSPETSATDQRGPRRTALVSIAAATVLVVLKLGTGLLTGSVGLISAGIESSGDVVAAVLTFFAIRLGVRPADADHHYGHRRAENLTALGEAAILTGGGVVVVFEAVGRLRGGGEPFEPRWYVFAVIGIALAIDVSRILVSISTARRYSSAALRSNAFHFAGDMVGTLAVLAGLLLVSAGFAQGDAVAALIVAGIIIAAAGRLIYENSRVLMDAAPPDAQTRAERAITSVRDGIELRRLRLRESGGHYFADAVVVVPPGQAIVEGHGVADDVEAAVRAALPGSDVVVHLEPQRDGLDPRDRALAVALAEPLVREAHDVSLYEHDGRVSLSLHLKMPADLSLDQAHDVAERVKAGLRVEPDIAAVQTHMEPLERPLAAAPDGSQDTAEKERIRALVADRTGRPPRELSVMHTDAGRVVFLTVRVGEAVALPQAHELASRLEDDIRRGQSSIADVVVHTEP